MDWSRRACSRRGHVLYEPAEREYLDQVRADTELGTAWRCLRCGDFVLDVPTQSGPVADAPMPLRGKALRSRFVMRLLAIERIFRFVLVGLGAYAVWKFSNSQHALQLLFERNLTVFRPVAQHYGYDLDNSSVVQTIRKFFTYKRSDLDIAAIALAVYAVIELFEAIGLWLAKRWGEYFAAVATALFLPAEVYELTDHATKFKIATLVLNVLAVIYLLLAKRLFGIRGGGRAYEAELTSESLLQPAADAAATAAGQGVDGGALPHPTSGVAFDAQRAAAVLRTMPVAGNTGSPYEATTQLPLATPQAGAGAQAVAGAGAGAEPTLSLGSGEPPDGIVQA
jgi:uncharacterized membrane protein (DUF2068 family)